MRDPHYGRMCLRSRTFFTAKNVEFRGVYPVHKVVSRYRDPQFQVTESTWICAF